MNRSPAALLLLICAALWLSAQAGLLFRAPGLLATYDLPTHRHLAGIQVRSPTALWDDGWYAGHPTYAYPPLAHGLAAALMKRMVPDVGFKIAVAAAYVLSVPVIYVALPVSRHSPLQSRRCS